MSPIKPEPIEFPPDVKTRSIEYLPDIKLEAICCPADVKSETMDYTTDNPPTKRLKTLSPGPPSPSLKGKSKLEEEEDEEEDSCGVCLLEEGMSLRGLIDSCEHYFCFVCIMEWAKVESRCPICKRRFSTIRRPTKDGVFFSERIVNVPVRDQVYCHNGNATIGPSDPYSQVKCSICSLSTDEELLLLCDLCDSAAHSFCVGLGATVPEGDWFCQDCTLSRDEHAKVEPDATSDPNPCPPTSTKIHFTGPQVSINDIIRESSVTSFSRRQSLAECLTTQPTTVDNRISNTSNARTLKRCLNVHARIKVLRENWDGFRGGSLNFTSSFGDRIKESQPQTSLLNQESTKVSPGRGPYNIDKAWKMMDIAAKALGRKCGNKNSKDKALKHPVKKGSLPSAEGMVIRPNSRYIGGLKKNDRVDTSKNNVQKHRFQMLEKNNRNHVERELLPSSRNLNGATSNGQNLPRKDQIGATSNGQNLPRKDQIRATSNGQNPPQKYHIGDTSNGQNLPPKDHLGATSNAVGSVDKSSHFIRSPPLMATDKCHAKKEIDVTLEEKKSIKKNPQVDGIIRKVEDAKSEIQSLVKLNLKILSRDKKLEVDVFKEVARHATHSIMGACGIERPKAGFRFFQGPVCNHNETHKRPRSTLMPNSCRECFFVFVKDVVTTIAFDR